MSQITHSELMLWLSYQRKYGTPANLPWQFARGQVMQAAAAGAKRPGKIAEYLLFQNLKPMRPQQNIKQKISQSMRMIASSMEKKASGK